MMLSYFSLLLSTASHLHNLEKYFQEGKLSHSLPPFKNDRPIQQPYGDWSY